MVDTLLREGVLAECMRRRSADGPSMCASQWRPLQTHVFLHRALLFPQSYLSTGFLWKTPASGDHASPAKVSCASSSRSIVAYVHLGLGHIVCMASFRNFTEMPYCPVLVTRLCLLLLVGVIIRPGPIPRRQGEDGWCAEGRSYQL